MADAWRFQHHLGQQEKWTRSVVCEAKHELKLQIDYDSDHYDHYDLYKKSIVQEAGMASKQEAWRVNRHNLEIEPVESRLGHRKTAFNML